MTTTEEAVLKHFGVKGMKWGRRKAVRNDQGHEGQRVSEKKIAKLDKKFDKNLDKRSTFIEFHNRTADDMNSKLDALNSKPEFKDVDLGKNPKLMAKYNAMIEREYIKSLQKTAESFGTNASGTQKYAIKIGEDGDWSVEVVDIKHSNSAPDSFVVRPKRDELGHIVGFEPIEDVVAQGEDFVDNVLAHYGVVGMKWGKHKSAASVSSPDHTEAQALKKKPLNEMSNADLKKLNERLQLEQTHKQLMAKQPTVVRSGQNFLKKTFVVTKTGQEIYTMINSPAGKAVRALIEKKLAG